jgi:8-oxo-dGTP pyrophosphatase MutT (NUDIX family)
MDPWTALRALPPVTDPPGTEYAVLVPLYVDGDGVLRIILTKRPEHMPTHPGDVVFPGGHRMDGEDPVATALREAHEEIGLPTENVVEVLGGLTPVTTRDRTRPIVPVVVRIDRPADLVPDPREVDVIIEPPLADLLDEARWLQRDWFGHDLWFFEFEEGILWGATAFMMRELLGVVRGGAAD